MACLIIGAGLAGLTLARALKSHSIQAIVFEAASNYTRQNHGLTLTATSYRPLAKLLGLSVEELLSKCAVDVGLKRKPAGLVDFPIKDGSNPRIRLNRRKLHEIIAQDGLDIRFNKKAVNLEKRESGVCVEYEDGEKIDGSCAVICDGVHSKLRTRLLSYSQPKILPYVCYAGTRRVATDKFEAEIRRHLQRGDVLLTSTSHKEGDATFDMSINDFNHERGFVELQWVYSRPPRDKNDPLHRPDRKIDEAKQIPSELYAEVEECHSNLPELFQKVFAVDEMRKDHANHWLLRTVSMDLGSLKKVDQDFNAILIGDAAHAVPIYQGYGGNDAILDGIELAEAIAAGTRSDFLSKNNGRWQESTKRSEAAFQ